MDVNRDFDTIYRENAILVYRFLIKNGCRPDLAEDVVQETFVKAIMHMDRFRGDCKLSVWLCQIAKNTYVSLLKKEKYVPMDSVSKIEEITMEDVEDEMVHEIMKRLKDMKEPYQTVFRYKVLMEMPYARIAKKYGKSESWARVTYYRAKIKLREMVRGDSYEDKL